MKKKNQAGQALVEFVIILPIFIFMILAVIDIGKILYYQNNLESKMDEVITTYEKNKNYDETVKKLEMEDDELELEVNNKDNKYVEFNLKKELDIVTPGLNLVFKNPYSVTVKRVIYYEP